MSTQQVTVTITGNAPGYTVTLDPTGPYQFSQANSKLIMTLDAPTVAAGFRIAGIGFEGIYNGRASAEAEQQISATVKSVNAEQDTLEVQDAVSATGEYEFVLLYQDSAGILYGLDPDILNDEP